VEFVGHAPVFAATFLGPVILQEVTGVEQREVE
jgi:hypothetical protein